MEHDYKPADIAVLLDKLIPYWMRIGGTSKDAIYTPTEYEKSLLEEYRTNQALRSAVNAVNRISFIRADNVGLDTNKIQRMMSSETADSMYHLWQKCLEIESKMSIYDLAPKMGF